MDPPRVISTRIVYENRWMRLHEDRTESANGREGLYAWVEKPPAAVVLPIDGADVWLASELEPGPRQLDDTEQGLRTARFALAEVERMLRDGRIADAASVAAFGLWRMR